MAERAEAAYDLVLVHSDPDFIRLEDSFPFTDRIAHLIAYTGFVDTAGAGQKLPKAMAATR